MKRLPLLVLSCAFLATLAACGTEPRRAAPPKGSAGGETTEAAEAPESPTAAGESKPEGWPGVDDDPSLEAPPGSGDWCGTDVRRRPEGDGGNFTLIRDGDRLVVPWIEDGKTVYLYETWSEPDAQGVRRRARIEPLTDEERLSLRDQRDVLEADVRQAKDPDAVRAARAELRRIYGRLAGTGPVWVQFGKTIGGPLGTFHMSREGESLEAFLRRITE